jgi:hypothetical protein
MPNPHFEVPTGAINDVNAVFTTSQAYTAGTVAVFRNGVLVKQTDDDGWTETDPAVGTVTLTEAPLTGDTIQIFYLDASTDFEVIEDITGILTEYDALIGVLEDCA